MTALMAGGHSSSTLAQAPCSCCWAALSLASSPDAVLPAFTLCPGVPSLLLLGCCCWSCCWTSRVTAWAVNAACSALRARER